jgi:hypothetical protein
MMRILLALLILASSMAGYAIARQASNPGSPRAFRKGKGPVVGDSGKVAARHAKAPSDPRASSSSKSSLGDSNPILDFFLPDLTEDQLERVLFAAVHRNDETGLAVLELFLASSDPALHDLVKKCLLSSWFLSRKVVDNCLSGIQLEQHRGRKLILAEVLGEETGHEGVVTFAGQVFSGEDDELKEKLLQNLKLGRFYGDAKEPISKQLQDIALNGRSDSLRAAAVYSMRGEDSENEVRFVLDRALHDPALGVRKSAISALPYNFSREDLPLWEEVMFGLYSLFRSPQTPSELRKPITSKLVGLVFHYRGDKLTEAQREEVINAWETYEPKSK